VQQVPCGRAFRASCRATPNASGLRSAKAHVPVRALAYLRLPRRKNLGNALTHHKKAIQRRGRSRRLTIRVIIGANPCFWGWRPLPTFWSEFAKAHCWRNRAHRRALRSRQSPCRSRQRETQLARIIDSSRWPNASERDRRTDYKFFVCGDERMEAVACVRCLAAALRQNSNSNHAAGTASPKGNGTNVGSWGSKRPRKR
jgi:hypothetical protein